MANSDFYRLVQPGGLNGGNRHMLDILHTDAMPWAVAPKLCFEHTFTWRDLRSADAVEQEDEIEVGGTIVAGNHSLVFEDASTGVELVTLTHVVHEDTVTIGGTASDGNYDTVFDALTPPVRVRTVRATTPATNANIATQHAADINDLVATALNGIVVSASANSAVVTIVYADGIDPQTLTCTETTATGTITASVSATASTVAAALEALIEDARGADEPLEDYVDDESVSTDTITVTYVPGVQVRVTEDFPGTSTAAIATVNTATLPMGDDGNLFYANVAVDGAGILRTIAMDGVTTIEATVGDAGAPAGLVTTTDLTATGFAETIAATEFVEHFEAAFSPVVTVTADGLFADLTAGEFVAQVFYNPVPNVFG